MLLDTAYALIVEGLDPDQRQRFDEELGKATGGEDRADEVARRAYALAHGEQR